MTEEVLEAMLPWVIMAPLGLPAHKQNEDISGASPSALQRGS